MNTKAEGLGRLGWLTSPLGSCLSSTPMGTGEAWQHPEARSCTTADPRPLCGPPHLPGQNGSGRAPILIIRQAKMNRWESSLQRGAFLCLSHTALVPTPHLSLASPTLTRAYTLFCSTCGVCASAVSQALFGALETHQGKRK